MSIRGDGDVRYVHRVKRKSSPISLSGSDNEDHDLLEIKPPQPKVRKPSHGHKYSDKRGKHKHLSSKYDYHSSSSTGNYYKPPHSHINWHKSDRKHHRYGAEKESGNVKDYYSDPTRDNYHKGGSKHRYSHHRSHDSKSESKPKEVRYVEEEQKALKDEIKKKQEDLRIHIEKRKHHQRKKDENGGVDVNNFNKFVQADRLKEAYHKESEERMRKHVKKHKQAPDTVNEKTPPRAYDTERSLANIVVVSDESRSESEHGDDDTLSRVIVNASQKNDATVRTITIDNNNKGAVHSASVEEVDEEEDDEDEDEDEDEEGEEEESSSDASNEEESSKGSSSSSEEEEEEVTSSSHSSSSPTSSLDSKEAADKLLHHEEDSSTFEDDVNDDSRHINKHSDNKNAPKNTNSAKNTPRESEEEMQVNDNQSSSQQQQQQQSELKPIIKKYFPALQGCRSVEQFHCLNKIEEGTYGIVYRARDKRTNQIVALKRLKMEKEKEGFPITSLREINTLLKAQHPNIVTVREIVVGSNMDKIFIVMDYVEHDLKSLMETMKQRKSSFIPSEVKCLMTQLLMAVDHLHDNWILHRDLKTSNLLFSHQGILKVGDFGLAREYGSPLKHYTSVVVTLWYRAPELLLGTKLYSTAIDMWSIGCIFAELILMEPLFTGKSEADQINRIFKLLGTPTEQQWSDFRKLPVVQKVTFANYPNNVSRTKLTPHMLTDLGHDLLLKFLAYDPKERITAEAALKHDFFKEHPVAIDPAMFPTWPAKSEPGSGYNKLKAESPKAPSGGQGYKDLGEDEGFFIGERSRGGPNYNSTFCLRF